MRRVIGLPLGAQCREIGFDLGPNAVGEAPERGGAVLLVDGRELRMLLQPLAEGDVVVLAVVTTGLNRGQPGANLQRPTDLELVDHG